MTSSIDVLAARLKRKQLTESWNIAVETLLVLKEFLSRFEWGDLSELVSQIKNIGHILRLAQPSGM